ncbi:MAG: hypothetical protein DCC55_24435 [Chloroflexi bacterium]|nr:MAG: hypothetical protein DCC55_24435 [Chloroflexota bacterium]
MLAKRVDRTLLTLMVAFLSVTAVAGGGALLTGDISPGLELLEGSPFASYVIPGLSLLVLVGGSAAIATFMMLGRHPLAVAASAVAGVMIMGFEVVEVLVIGSPAGLARNLQLFYFTLGLLITALTGWMWVSARGMRLAGVGHKAMQ